MKYTELKDYNRKKLIDIIPLQKPFTLLIEPSNFCNFRCVQCFQSIQAQSYITLNRGLMTMDTFIKIIDEMKNWEGPKLKVLKLSLYGEPFVNKDFCEMLRIAKEADIAERIETTTNASLLTLEICQKLVEYEIDYIRVSIYGVNQEQYRDNTNVENSNFQQICDSLKTLQELKRKYNKEKPFISAKMLDSYNKDNEIFMDIFKNVSDEVYIDKPHNWVAHEEKNFISSIYNIEQIEKMNEELKELKSNRIACPMPFTTMAVRSNGDVSPCCVDWLGGTNIGNVFRQSLNEIWNGDAMYEFRKMQLQNRRFENSSCAKCEIIQNDYYTKDNVDEFPIERLR